MSFSERETQLLAGCIRELEARTQAETLLVVRNTSDEYRDLAYLAGAIAAFLGLCFALFSPWEIFPAELLPTLVAVFWGVAWCVQRTRACRWLSSRKRREISVKRAAQAAFVEKRIAACRDRMGILLFQSRLER